MPNLPNSPGDIGLAKSEPRAHKRAICSSLIASFLFDQTSRKCEEGGKCQRFLLVFLSFSLLFYCRQIACHPSYRRAQGCQWHKDILAMGRVMRLWTRIIWPLRGWGFLFTFLLSIGFTGRSAVCIFALMQGPSSSWKVHGHSDAVISGCDKAIYPSTRFSYGISPSDIRRWSTWTI